MTGLKEVGDLSDKTFPTMGEVSGEITELMNEKLMSLHPDPLVCLSITVSTITMVITNMMMLHDELFKNFDPEKFLTKMNEVSLMRFLDLKSKVHTSGNTH